MTMKGTLIAASVAGLFSAAAPFATAADQKDGEQITCSGINACKGHGACASGSHGCAGKNGRKGQGLTKTTKKDCADKSGTVYEAKDDKDAKAAKKPAKGKGRAKDDESK